MRAAQRRFGFLGGLARARDVGLGEAHRLGGIGGDLGGDLLGFERGDLRRDVPLPLGQPRGALGILVAAAGERGALRILGGDLLRQARQLGIERRHVLGDGGERGGGALLRRAFLGLCRDQRLALGFEPLERRFRIGGERFFARDVGGHLIEPRDRGLMRGCDAAILFLERLAREDEALQLGAGGGLGLAQRRQLAGRGFALAFGGERGAGAVGDLDLGDAETRGGGFVFGDGALPAEMQHHRFGAADMVGKAAIAIGLARLLLQAVELLAEAAQHIIEPREIALGGFEAKLGLVAARMQPADARGLFQENAALGGFGIDDRADAALADEGGGMRAGRGIGEEQLHVARAHFAAIDAVVGAHAALDAAHDLELRDLVIGFRRIATRILEREHDLGEVARRPAIGAAEDDIVHLAAAHALGRVLAHRPAQRLDEIRFAAAIRADDAGQAGIDDELGRIDEGFETAEP